ncbi:NAD(P)/FAD-dependent oxidoreductase [Lyngbya confervoides]|uniref:FAD-binding oxidoreductase n=1 Tax=Lyngbya confervoides BDU141951 TaxID=1574623 RepID=A0ABD4T3X9_9CYAN|nr:FAD-dependent oxidoreductase [Lyngbya confervoides]MCM1983371.1 FAD-binding oxidoreductase [Lyngbya confervoides BDU141951]
MRIGIVGGGVVGAAIAYHLSQNPAYTIQVWEARSPQSFGSTGAALGVLMAVISGKLKGRHVRLRLESIRLFDEWVDCLQTQTQTELPYNRAGIVQLLFDVDQWARWEKTQAARIRKGFELERWTRADLLARYPFLDQARCLQSGSACVGAIYSPSDRQINPVAFTQACRQAAQDNGVQFYYESTIHQLVTHQATVTALRTESLEVPLDLVILAAGLGSTPLTAQLAHPIPLRPVLGQALRLRLLSSAWPLPCPVITGNDVHLVPLTDQELWVGATVEFPAADCAPDNSPQAPVPDVQLLRAVQDQAIALCPSLAASEVVETWSGLRPRPVDRTAPIIEWLSPLDNVLLATGHYRNGVLLAPVTATKVAGLIAQRFS